MRASLIFLCIALLCFFAFLIVTQIMRERRIRQIARITGTQPGVIKARAEKLAPKDSIERRLKTTVNSQHQLKKGGLRDLIQQAGYRTSIRKFWLYSVITAVVTFFVLKLWGVNPIALFFLTLTALLGLPRFYLKRKAGKRQKQFLTDFPDALEAMVRLLKAGMPVTEAIAMASREFQGPVAEEMGFIYDQQRIGISMPDAAEKVAIHIPIPEVQMFATALAIQTETGASLSEVLMNLSGVIRARFRLKRKIQALSSEARASAMIIGSLPIIVAILLNLVNPGYMSLMFETSTGQVMLWGCGVWMCIGILVMRQMINFRI